MKKHLLALVLVIAAIGSAIAQRTITGKVTDTNGEALIGANIFVLKTTVGTVTDINGSFTLNVPAGAEVISVSYTGFTSKEIEIGNLSTIDVQLEQGSILDEVVVTALGIQKQPKELGYSIARVSGEDLTQARVTKLQNGLVGKVSGLNVTTANNGINADTRIVLRGVRSLLGNNQALLVVDGTPVNLNFINSINPNDVQSVNVLKGANAAALYGPEGVNGVIVVNTKKGNGGGRPQISIGNTTLFERVSLFLNQQGEFGSGSSYDRFGDGVYDPIENQSWGPKFDGTVRPIGQETFEGQTQEIPYTYLPKEKIRFWDTGLNIQNDVSVNTGDEKSNFFFSVQNIGIKGIMPSDKGDRTTVRLNAGKTMGIFNAGMNFGYTQRNDDVTSRGGDVFTNVLNAPGHIPLTRYKDINNDYWSNRNNYYNDYFDNPYQTINDYRRDYRQDDFFGNVVLGLKPWKWATLTNRLGYTLQSSYGRDINRYVDYSDFAILHRSFATGGDEKASVSDFNAFNTRLNNELILTTDHRVGNFNIKGLLGNLIRTTYSKTTGVSGANLVIPTLFNVGNRTGEPGASSTLFESRLNSVFGSLTLGYNDYLFVEVTARNDWDSRLPAENRSYFYPGVSASLLLTEMVESLKGDLFSSIKLKGAYAQTGNVNLGIYQLESTFFQAGGFPYGGLAGFSASDRINNPLVRPEVVNSTEIGAEFGLFKNRVLFDVAYYFQNNNDQVVPINISGSTGYTSALLNAAEFNNKGWEFDLRLLPLLSTNSGLRWEVSANYTYNTSEVISIYEGLDELFVGNTAYVIKGLPAYVHKVTDWQRTPEGKVIIDPISGYPNRNTVSSIFGNTNPKHIIGINTDLSFRGIGLKVVAEYRGGNFIYNALGTTGVFTGVSELSAINGRQRFVFPNSVYSNDGGKTYVENKDIVVTNAHYDFIQADRFRSVQSNYLTSAAFWKLREVALSYDIPNKLLGGGKYIQRATIALVARNALMLRPKTNIWTDPEFSNSTGNDIGTTSLNQSPPTRIYGFNINLTF
jgi:TonB-linked SusC/RagA family outer membrane protein